MTTHETYLLLLYVFFIQEQSVIIYLKKNMLHCFYISCIITSKREGTIKLSWTPFLSVLVLFASLEVNSSLQANSLYSFPSLWYYIICVYIYTIIKKWYFEMKCLKLLDNTKVFLPRVIIASDLMSLFDNPTVLDLFILYSCRQRGRGTQYPPCGSLHLSIWFRPPGCSTLIVWRPLGLRPVLH